MAMSDSKTGDLPLRGSRVSLRDLAYEAMRDAFINGVLAPGHTVTEEHLAKRLDVSRTIVREAVQRLVAEGLLQRTDNGRLHVKDVTRGEALSLYAVRSALEQLAVEEAIAHMTADGEAALTRDLERMREASEAGAESVGIGGGEFHSKLMMMAGNQVNSRVLDQLMLLIDRYRYMSTDRGAKGRAANSVHEHEMILSAIVERDVHRARKAMAVHIEAALSSALAALD